MIRNDDELYDAIKLVEHLWNATPGTPEADMLDCLATEIDRYENATIKWEDDGGKPKD